MILRQIIRPLPARAAPLAGESLASLVRRTTAAMGYENVGRIASLLPDRRHVPAHGNLYPPGPRLNRLAQLLGRNPEDLLAMIAHRFAEQLVLTPCGSASRLLCDFKTVLKYFVTSTSPICPQCLAEDPIPYERLTWSVRALPVCLSHRCLLVTHCPACRRSLRWDRNDVCRCRCGSSLELLQPQEVGAQAIELARVLGQLLKGQVNPLPEMSSAATFWWAERLATAIAKTPTWMDDFAKRMELQPGQATERTAWLSAAEILTDWPSRLEKFLAVFQQMDKCRTTSTGISRRFGLLLREAASLEEIGYPGPARALRDYLLGHYSAGHLSGKVCLFQNPVSRSLLARRPWITQTEAAGMLGIRHAAIASLVGRRILVGEIHAAGHHGRTVGLVTRQSVEALRSDLRSALNVATAARRLGIGRHAVFDLIHDNVLPRAVRTAKGWQVPRQSVRDLETFCTNLPRALGRASGWISLREATRIAGPTGIGMSQIVRWILSGSLRARMAEAKEGLNGIVVSTLNLAALLKDARDHGEPQTDWSLHRAARGLFTGRPMKVHVLRRWIRSGLLQARQEGPRTWVSAEEIRRFRAEYCLAQDACRMLGVSRSTLARWEVEGRLVPVYGKRVTPQAGFSLYRREDLRPVLRAAS